MLIKRADGTRYKIFVNFWQNLGDAVYESRVEMCLKGKRKFKNITGELLNSYEYRSLEDHERSVAIQNEKLKHVTKEEIYAAKFDKWHELKPHYGDLI